MLCVVHEEFTSICCLGCVRDGLAEGVLKLLTVPFRCHECSEHGALQEMGFVQKKEGFF